MMKLEFVGWPGARRLLRTVSFRRQSGVYEECVDVI